MNTVQRKVNVLARIVERKHLALRRFYLYKKDCDFEEWEAMIRLEERAKRRMVETLVKREPIRRVDSILFDLEYSVDVGDLRTVEEHLRSLKDIVRETLYGRANDRP